MELYTEDDVLTELRRRVAVIGSQERYALMAGICGESVRLTLKGKRAPSPAILNALGFKRSLRYVRGESEQNQTQDEKS